MLCTYLTGRRWRWLASHPTPERDELLLVEREGACPGDPDGEIITVTVASPPARWPKRRGAGSSIGSSARGPTVRPPSTAHRPRRGLRDRLGPGRPARRRDRARAAVAAAGGAASGSASSATRPPTAAEAPPGSPGRTPDHHSREVSMPTTIRVPAMLGGDEVGSCEVDVDLSADLTVTLNDWRLDRRTATEITARLRALGVPSRAADPRRDHHRRRRQRGHVRRLDRRRHPRRRGRAARSASAPDRPPRPALKGERSVPQFTVLIAAEDAATRSVPGRQPGRRWLPGGHRHQRRGDARRPRRWPRRTVLIADLNGDTLELVDELRSGRLAATVDADTPRPGAHRRQRRARARARTRARRRRRADQAILIPRAARTRRRLAAPRLPERSRPADPDRQPEPQPRQP